VIDFPDNSAALQQLQFGQFEAFVSVVVALP
jgi:hypothetical protein